MNVSSNKLEIFEHLRGSYFYSHESMEICACENQIYWEYLEDTDKSARMLLIIN